MPRTHRPLFQFPGLYLLHCLYPIKSVYESVKGDFIGLPGERSLESEGGGKWNLAWSIDLPAEILPPIRTIKMKKYPPEM